MPHFLQAFWPRNAPIPASESCSGEEQPQPLRVEPGCTPSLRWALGSSDHKQIAPNATAPPQGTALLLPTSYLNPKGRDFFIQRKPMRTAGDKQTGELPAVRTAPREEICLTLEEGPEGTGPAASFIALLSAGEAATSEQLR